MLDLRACPMVDRTLATRKMSGLAPRGGMGLKARAGMRVEARDVVGVVVGVGVLAGERVDSVRVRVGGGREVRVEERVVVRRCTVGLGLWDVLVCLW